MAFQTQRIGDLEYLTADVLAGSDHCFSTRSGGVSRGTLASMNLGIHRGDDPAFVVENYRILGRAVGFVPENTVFTVQKHTDIIRRVGKSDCGLGLYRQNDTTCDGIITDQPEVALCCFSADCTPILLFDPVRGAAAAVHAGWRGTAARIAAKAVSAMQSAFSCRPQDIRAAIGPCISVCCFEVGPEVSDAMRHALGQAAEDAICQGNEKDHVDLKKLNQIILKQAGVDTIDICADCTMCQPDRFWSHRATGGIRGSLAAIIQLRK